MALAATILELRNRARDRAEADLDRPQAVETWRRDIGEVYASIRAALAPYERDGSASFDLEEVEVTEETLGANLYERLVIEIVGHRLIVSPIARFTIGGTGRIDIYRENRPSEDDRVFIVRGVATPGLDHLPWLIEQKGEVKGLPPIVSRGLRRYQDLEPAAIENAVEYLLKLR